MTRRRKLSHHIFRARLAAVLVIAVALGRIAAVASAALAVVMLPVRWLGSGETVEAADYPGLTVSRYVNTNDYGDMEQLGCQRGSTEQDGAIILAFGGPAFQGITPGTVLYNGQFANTLQIRSLAQGFANGYMYCRPLGSNAEIRLIVGTSNYIVGTTEDYAPFLGLETVHGAAWGNMINNLNDYLAQSGFAGVIQGHGGNDIEQDPNDGWAGPEPTGLWVLGYDSAESFTYYNFGSCDGCPYNGNGWQPLGGWAVGDIFYVSWGSPAALPLPQIYRPDGIQAEQWQEIKLWGVWFDSHMIIQGALTQWNACFESGGLSACPYTYNTPDQGWSQLHWVLESDPQTAQGGLPFSTDVAKNK
jgi:hypothetical protein